MDYSAHICLVLQKLHQSLQHVGRKNDDSGTGHDASPVHSSPLLRLNMYDELQSSPLAAVLAMYDNVRTPRARPHGLFTLPQALVSTHTAALWTRNHPGRPQDLPSKNPAIVGA